MACNRSTGIGSKTASQAVLGNLPLILFAGLGILWLLPMVFDVNYSLIASEGLGSIILSLILVVHYSKNRKSLAHFFYCSNFKVRLILTVSFILFMYFFAVILGNFHAILLASGVSSNSQEITLELKEANIDIQNKSLILVLHYAGNYYLVEKSVPVSNYPLLYIIPDDQVKMAKVRRIR